MKVLYTLVLLIICLVSCKSYKTPQVINRTPDEGLVKNDTVVINSDENDYKLIIIEPGFRGWLQSTARPRGYYSQEFLESRNRLFVQEWNARNLQPSQYNPNLYEIRIEFDPFVDYGYEINYKLYNYFIYFQLTYKQQLTGFIPRI